MNKNLNIIKKNTIEASVAMPCYVGPMPCYVGRATIDNQLIDSKSTFIKN